MSPVEPVKEHPDFEDLENRFTYHAPREEQVEHYTKIRDSAKALAHIYLIRCPLSRELSLALTNLEQSVFWANAAIARRSPK